MEDKTLTGIEPVDEVETEEENFDDSEGEGELDKRAKIVSHNTDWTVETIILQIQKGKIKLDPIFQRHSVWSRKKKSLFIESLLLNYPVPNILLAEDGQGSGAFIVIDGKQRLLTLMEFYDVLGEKGIKLEGLKTLRLKGLKTLTDFNKKTRTDLEETNSFDLERLDNYTIRTSVVMNIPDNRYIYDIFARINTGSVRLNPQELRQSKFPGEFTEFVSEKAQESKMIKILLKMKETPHNRMNDVELLLRGIAFKFRLGEYNNSSSLFLDDTTEHFNKNWSTTKSDIELFCDRLEKGMELVVNILGEDAFTLYGLDRKKKNFSRAVFDMFMYYFSEPRVQKELKYVDKKKFKESYFEYMKKDQEFIKSISENTHQTNNVKTRIKKMGGFLEKTYKIKTGNEKKQEDSNKTV